LVGKMMVGGIHEQSAEEDIQSKTKAREGNQPQFSSPFSRSLSLPPSLLVDRRKKR